MTAAVAELLTPGRTVEDARQQLSLRYLYIRLGDGRIMAELFDQYENWLTSNQLEHTPEVFRQWVNIGYQPGEPNREEWPYDPFPLVVERHPPFRKGQSAKESVRSTDTIKAIKR
jgi:hypothetical protein